MNKHERGANSSLDVERQGAVAIVRYANPPEGLISNRGAILLCEAFDELLKAADIRAIVLTGGDEGVFIRHADVSGILRAADALKSGVTTPADFERSAFLRLTSMIEAATKPVIAAIDGICMGGGFEIALACTIRIASPAKSAIGLPEIKIDLIPGAGGISRLAALLGWHRARRLVLNGEVFDGDQALREGLVDELAEFPVDRAIELAGSLARRNPLAVRAIMTEVATCGTASSSARQFASILLDGDTRATLQRYIDGNEGLDKLP